ncbi:LOW QUALITY PROTEIN: hypothetical protein Cgig2_030756 [Carnegiea gigantea]|uniref:Protein FAR1-RELATED SEQUENCE n=1 Tax=Carnegiea gigantea TaxID=171969 RepID=A0A9Q1KTP6_9CARY|nr:LOW QUALITY PROTEIN: hypothetical protein Cgig2_030756 [Carnegiea gigantea]
MREAGGRRARGTPRTTASPRESLGIVSGPMVAAVIRMGPSLTGRLIVIDEVLMVGNSGPGLVGEGKKCPAVVVEPQRTSTMSATVLDAREDNSKYIIMFDRHMGIIKALKDVMPQTSRRICVLHFHKNFVSNYPEVVFKKTTEKIKKKDIFFTLARFKFDHTLKLDANTNNFVESFNNTIVKHTRKPIYTMLEEIRKLVGVRFDTRFQMSAGKEKGKAREVQEKEKQTFHPSINTFYTFNTKRCKKCKQLGHNSLTCGKPRDETCSLKYKKKPRQKTDNPVGRPKRSKKSTKLLPQQLQH